jgi:hypothetical protein
MAALRMQTTKGLLMAVGSVLCMCSAQARHIPYCLMDSLALQAEAIVFCEELGFDVERYTRGRYRIVESFKGQLAPGAEIAVDLGFTLTRRFCHWPPEWSRIKRAGRRTEAENEAPLAKALLFLRMSAPPGEWEVVCGGVKLIQADMVLAYLQCNGNPGPLVLIDQLAENIDLPTGKQYDWESLRADLAMALAKARTMKHPVFLKPLAVLGRYESHTLKGVQWSEDDIIGSSLEWE